MKSQLARFISEILKEQGIDAIVEVSVPEDPAHGDYTTNVAMTLAKTLKMSPMDIALQVKERITYHVSRITQEERDQNISKNNQKISEKIDHENILQAIDRVEVAPPGFINFFLTEAKLVNQLAKVLSEKESYGTAKSSDSSHNKKLPAGKAKKTRPERSRRIMVEFAHPNTHKAFHIGHLRNITTGESIVRLLEATGHNVVRANYQGDVGMHIAKALYALLHVEPFKGIMQAKQSTPGVKDVHTPGVSLGERVEFLGKAYAAGSKAFDESEEAKKEIGEINLKIYAKDPEVYPTYQKTRQWSLDYFEAIYKRVGSHYDRYYFEGEVYERGKANVLEGVKKGIFVSSDGAIIFPGKKFGLHNRVFITKEGNATYEGKDMGLGPLQFSEYHPDLIIHVVGPEQASYFQVVFEALAQLFPETKGKEFHLIYGWVKLKQGKMSSRSGNVVLGEWLLDEAKKSIYEIIKQSDTKYTEEEPSDAPTDRRSYGRAKQNDMAEKAAVAAVKYSFLRVSTQNEIAFDIKESVNLQGDSGPYLQYTYARARSVLRKAGDTRYVIRDTKDKNTSRITSHVSLNSEERAVARLILYFPDIVADAAKNYAPNTLCTYLFHLAQAFNLFYAKHTILAKGEEVSSIKYQVSSKDKDMTPDALTPDAASFRLALTAATAQIIKNGLYLLGIDTLEQM